MVKRSDSGIPSRQEWRVLLPTALIACPIVLKAIYIRRFAVNIPFWDQWQFVPALRLFHQGGDWLQAIWQPHDVHRHFFSKFIFLILADLSDWNVVAEMYCSLALACLSLMTMGLIYHKVSNRSLWGFIPIAWLLFSLGQWENILWGWQVSIYLMVLAVILTFYLLSRQWPASILLAAVSGIVASYSFSNGLLVWPIGLLALLAWRAETKKILLWAAVSLSTIAFYFVRFDAGYVHSTITKGSSQPYRFVTFLLANIGAPLGGMNLTLSVAAGAFLVVTVIIILYAKLGADEASKFLFTDADITLGSLLLFSLLSSLVITLGRISFGHFVWAIGSRYVTITSLGIASIYILLSNMANSTRRFSFLFTCFLVVLVTGLALSYRAGFHMGQVKYAQMLRMQYALQNYERQPDSALANMYASPQSVRNQAEYLKERELSAFSQAMDLVLFTVLGQGLPLGEILPDHPAVQRFNCPVSTLRDVGILFATYGRHNNSTIRITLTDDDETVWQQTLSTIALADNTFQRFPLTEPIQSCRGHNLVLRIDSLDGTPGNAVTVWTYPAYYDARLIDPSIPSLEGQVIGLELNASAYGLARCDTCG